MIQTQISCDQCGTLKKETNHWWVIFPSEDEGGIVLEPLGKIDPDRDVVLSTEKHLCSRHCVDLTISQFMNKTSNG